MRKSNAMTFLFLLPAVLIFLVFTLYPLLHAGVTSFLKMDFMKGESSFAGFDNFSSLLEHPAFWTSLQNTVLFVILAVLFEALLGTAMAIFLNSAMKGIKWLRTLTLLPMLLPPITVALTWKMMYDYEFGIVNHVFEWFGMEPLEWLSSADLALYAIVLTDIWQWTPFVILIILASLQAIPEEIYESARVAGAGAAQCLRYITLPLLKPAIILVLLLRTIDTFQVFEKMYVLTGGGPGNATETITFYIYRYGFRYFETGYAAAASIVLVFCVIFVSIGYIKRVFRSSSQSER